MKRILFFILTAAAAALFAVSCTPTEENFDETLLYAGDGKWTFTETFAGSQVELGHKFNSDGTGYEVNITQEQFEHQTFSWELVGSRLTFIHDIQIGGSTPEDCTVSTLSETTLIYTTESGDRVVCTKKSFVEPTKRRR